MDQLRGLIQQKNLQPRELHPEGLPVIPLWKSAPPATKAWSIHG